MNNDVLSDAFQSSTITILNNKYYDSSRSMANAFYRDSSRRARVCLDIKIEFATKKDWDIVQNSGLMESLNDLDSKETEKDEMKEDAFDSKSECNLRFECHCNEIEIKIENEEKENEKENEKEKKETSNLNQLTVEAVKILSCTSEMDITTESTTDDNKEFLKVHLEVTVRAASIATKQTSSSTEISSNEIEKEVDILNVLEKPIHVDLSVQAVFSIRQKLDTNSIESYPISPRSAAPEFIGDLSLGLLALESGSSVITKQKTKKNLVEQQYESKFIRSIPQIIPLQVMNPFTVTVREIGGARAATGATLISLTMAHSNLHELPVTIHNIALHPGHSRETTSNYDYRSIHGTDDIIDMSRHVRWGYAPGTAPTLPFVLSPYEALSTVIKIDASDNLSSRTLFAPIAVVAEMGSNMDRLLVTTDAKYTTSREAEELSDTFRIDMSLCDTRYKVGAPLVVSLRVLNLSDEDRDLMLLMAKDEDKSTKKEIKKLHQSVNTAVVSEVNGYTFGVWGLAGDDDGTTRHNRDHELLAVDAALLLGEVKGQHSIEAELRFVPLREGTLDVPNLKLYDKLSEKWYNCVHMLKIVASNS